MATPHVSNDEKLQQLARDTNNLAARKARTWVVFDVRLNYRAPEARIGSTEEIENIIGKVHEAGYLLYRTESYAIPLGAGAEPRAHVLLIFHAAEL